MSDRGALQRRKWPWIALFFALAAAFVVLGYVYYRNNVRAAEEREYQGLHAISDLKVRQIQQWREERIAGLRSLVQSPYFAAAVEEFVRHPDVKDSESRLQQSLMVVKNDYRYQDALLVDLDGRILVSADNESHTLDPETVLTIRDALSSGRAVFGDLYRSSLGRIYIDAAAPLLGKDDRPTAVLVFRIDPATELFPLIQSWPTPSKTGETLLVRKEGDQVLFLNDLRHQTNSALRIREPLANTDLPAARAVVSGRHDHMEGIDYRDVKVIAVFMPIPGSPWFMVAKMDSDELLAGVHREARFISLLVGMLICLSGVGTGLVFVSRQKGLYTDLYLAEKERAEGRKKFLATLYSIGDAVIVTDTAGSMQHMNRIAEMLTGWTEAEALGRPLEEVFHIVNEQTRERVENPMQLVLRQGSVVGLANHTLLIARDGTEHPIADSGAPIRDERDAIIGVVLVFRDQTQERLLQRFVETRLSLLEYAAGHTLHELLTRALDEVGAFVESPIGFYHFVEPDQETISLQQWSTRTLKEFCRAEGNGMHYGIAQAGVWVDCVSEKRPVIHNDYASLPHKKGMPEGHAEVIRELVVPVMREDKVVAILGVGNKSTDYTQRDVETVSYLADVTWEIVRQKRAEESLRESEERFRRLYEQSPAPYQSLDSEGNILDVNNAWLEDLGYERGDVIGKWFGDFLAADGPALFAQRFARFKALGEVHGVEFEMKRKCGATIAVSYEGRISLDEKGEFVRTHCVFTNITERRNAEVERERLSRAIEQAAEAVMITDAEGTILYVNPAFEKITGFSSEEAVAANPRLLKSGEHDGSFYKGLWDTIKAGNVWAGRLTNRRKDGRLYYEDATISPVRDSSGKIVNFVAVKRDMTEHLELSKQLLQAQKMEAVGTLAGGVAHDFNNILQIALGYSELILGDEEFPRHHRADLKKIHESATRGADLVQRLLTFSRKTEIKPRPLNLNRRITELRKMLERTIPKMIDIQLFLGENLTPIYADPTQIDQVLMNLALNARDAMPEGGRLTIETANIILDEEYARIHLDANPGRHIVLMVMDTGSGMDKDTLEHIFEPFYTTKLPSQGTGLGLAMVHGIVKHHKGHVRCYSEPGQGTTFKIYFPALISDAEKEEATVSRMPRGGSETVLLVDDEKMIRDLGSRILTKAGYNVITTSNGKEALHVYQERRHEIALVILDVIMPEIDGKKCLEGLLSLNPGVRVVIASGHPANAPSTDALAAGAKGFVNKPYHIRQLLEVVREVLDSD